MLIITCISGELTAADHPSVGDPQHDRAGETSFLTMRWKKRQGEEEEINGEGNNEDYGEEKEGICKQLDKEKKRRKLD